MLAGELVRQKLLAGGITKYQLMEQLGIKRTMAEHMLKADRNIAIWHLDGIAALLGVSVRDLFLETEETEMASLGENVATGESRPASDTPVGTASAKGGTHADEPSDTASPTDLPDPIYAQEAPRQILREAIERLVFLNRYLPDIGDDAGEQAAASGDVPPRRDPPRGWHPRRHPRPTPKNKVK